MVWTMIRSSLTPALREWMQSGCAGTLSIVAMSNICYLKGMRKPCSFPGCDSLTRKHGLCDAHAGQRARGTPLHPVRKHGVPNPVIVRGDTAWIVLTRHDGTERDRVALDTADVPMVIAHRWVCSSCGGRNDLTYASAREGRKTIYMHRLLLDVPKGSEVDHIDGNGLNNKRENLRIVGHPEQLQNLVTRRGRGKNVNSDGGTTRPWAARLQVGGVRVSAGYFATEDEAVEWARRLRAAFHPFANEERVTEAE